MTAQRQAIAFGIHSGSGDEVRAILATYGQPEYEVDDRTRLLSTTILMRDDLVVRVIEIEGSFPAVMQHLGRQPAIQAVELAINPYLVVDRDMSSPAGIRRFFMNALMLELAPPGPIHPPGEREPGLEPHGVLVQLATGQGRAADGLFTAGADRSVFRQDDALLLFCEVTGGREAAIDHLAEVGVADGNGAALSALLATPANLSDREGWRALLRAGAMDVITHRVAGPAPTPRAPAPSPRAARRPRATERVIDFHSHLVPRRWERLGDIPPAMLDLDGFFERKEAEGISLAVLINAMFHHPRAHEDLRGLDAVREFTDFASNLIAAHPGRVTALVGVNPFLGDPALRAMEEAITGAGMPGVTVNSSVDGRLLDAPEAGAFWALAAELGVPVFVHPPLFLAPGQVDWDARFLGFVARPLDVTLGMAAIVLGGVLEKHPELRIVCAAGGGAIGALAERLNNAYSAAEPSLGGLSPGGQTGATGPPLAALTLRPSEYIRRLYVDTCVHGVHALMANLEQFGAGHVVFGTDSPPLETLTADEIQLIESVLPSDQDRRRVLHDNAAGLLGLEGTAKGSAYGPEMRTATS